MTSNFSNRTSLRSATRRLGVSALAMIAAAGMAFAAQSSVLAEIAPSSTAGSSPDAKAAATFAKSLSAAFRNAASTVGGSVVSIRVEKKASDSPAFFHGGPEGSDASPALPPGMEKFMERFFQGQGMPAPHGGAEPRGQNPSQGRHPAAPMMQGQGSGVITTADGMIVTNAHVVDGADTMTVVLADSNEYPAKLIGIDKDSDLAVIKIDATGLTAARFADSDQVQPGDWCVAVGTPFGLDHTVTAGIVSAKGRSGVGAAAFEDFIQTDASINPGNSGGPLVNLDGEIIGMNTAIRSSSGGSIGIGFAIPSTTIQSVMADLIKDGHVERGWLGVSIQPLTPDLAASMSAKPKAGVLIGNVMVGAPAAKAGIQDGDIVTAVNGQAVTEPGQLMSRIARVGPGKAASLTILRDGSEQKISVTLGKRPANPGAEAAKPAATANDRLGMSVQPLDKELRGQFNLGEDQRGLVITDVTAGSPAERAGLQPGDLILSAGGTSGKELDSAEQFGELSAKATAEKGLLLRVKRGDNARFVVVKPER